MIEKIDCDDDMTKLHTKCFTYILGYIDFKQVKIKQAQNLGNKIIQYCKLVTKNHCVFF